MNPLPALGRRGFLRKQLSVDVAMSEFLRSGRMLVSSPAAGALVASGPDRLVCQGHSPLSRPLLDIALAEDGASPR
jgi:hypothetical protein